MRLMGNLLVKLNRDGVKELLRSAEMMAICNELANDVIQRAGDGFVTSEHRGKNRVNVSVHAATKKAKRECLKHNALLKALR